MEIEFTYKEVHKISTLFPLKIRLKMVSKSVILFHTKQIFWWEPLWYSNSAIAYFSAYVIAESLMTE